MNVIEVRHRHGDLFEVEVRGHSFWVDQPVPDGGDDFGPTPTELFVAGLASCVGFYAARFLSRHDIAPTGLAVDCAYEMSTDRPARVSRVTLDVRLPAGFPEQRREALMRVVEHCTVHNSIRMAPEVEIALTAAEQAA